MGAAEERADYGPEIAREIDAEVRWILDQQHSRATRLLSSRRDVLVRAAERLVDREAMTGAELQQLVAAAETADRVRPAWSVA